MRKNPEGHSSQLIRGGTRKSHKFLLARRHKYQTPTFLVCTTHWRVTNNFTPRTYRMASIPRPKYQNFRPHESKKCFLVNWAPVKNSCYYHYQTSAVLSKIFLRTTFQDFLLHK